MAASRVSPERGFGRTMAARCHTFAGRERFAIFVVMTKYIADEAHFKEVIERVPKVRKSLWIGTADIKDLYVEDFDQYPVLFRGLERSLCPRVHFKIIIFDMQTAYIGSANLTGAGIGMKSTRTRNFEAGILTDEPELVDAAVNQFDSVWAGFKCKTCGRRQYCGDPILK